MATTNSSSKGKGTSNTASTAPAPTSNTGNTHALVSKAPNGTLAYTLGNGTQRYVQALALAVKAANPCPLPAGHTLAVLATSSLPPGNTLATLPLTGVTLPTTPAQPATPVNPNPTGATMATATATTTQPTTPAPSKGKGKGKAPAATQPATPTPAPASPTATAPAPAPRTLAPVGTNTVAPQPQPGTSAATNGKALPNSKVRVLRLLAAAPQGLTRKQLASATGQVKGWAALLGAPTKGACLPGTLQGAGYVHSAVCEGTRGMVYTITPAGTAYLASLPPAAPATAPTSNTPS